MDVPVFFSWRSAMMQSSLPALTRLVLHTIGCHMNVHGEGAFPSEETLARETGLSRRSIVEHVRNAREQGWIVVSKHGYAGRRWARNEYHLAWPPGVMCGPRGEADQPAGGSAGDALPHAGGSAGDAPPQQRGSADDDIEVVQELRTSSPVNTSIPIPLTPECNSPPARSLDGGNGVFNSTGAERRRHSPLERFAPGESAERQTAGRVWRQIRSRFPNQRAPDLDRWARELAALADTLPMAGVAAVDEVERVWRAALADEWWQSRALTPRALSNHWETLQALADTQQGAATCGTPEDRQCGWHEADGSRCARPGRSRDTGWRQWFCGDHVEPERRRLERLDQERWDKIRAQDAQQVAA